VGIVRLGWQRALRRRVAVKTLRDEARDPRTTLRLLREAWITGALEHPNVVPVHDLSAYGHFGAARFGYQQSLRAWRENAAARDALTELTALMVARNPAEAPACQYCQGNCDGGCF